MSEMFGYEVDKRPEPNYEGWKVLECPKGDQSAEPEKSYRVQDKVTEEIRYVDQTLGYVGKDGCFHYHPQFAKVSALANN